MTQISDKAALAAFEKWAEQVDPATVKVQDVSDLREVALAADAVAAGEARLRERCKSRGLVAARDRRSRSGSG